MAEVAMVDRSAKVEPSRLALLDTFRFAAALAVLVYHWFYRGIETGHIDTIGYSAIAGAASYGYLGVHLFFLISGFVIASSAMNKTPAQFAVGRMVRLYPSYWVAMVFTALTTAFFGAAIMSVTAPQVLANFTMVSRLFGQPYVDSVYWTLFHELVFYFMVFALLVVGLRKHLDIFFPVWALGLAFVSALAPSLMNQPLLGGIYALFAGGAIISTVQRRGWSVLRAVGLLASLFAAEIYVYRDLVEVQQGDRSALITALLVFGFYLLLLAQIRPALAALRIPGSRLMGSLTYPIYLIHGNFGIIMIETFANEANKWIVYAATFAAVLLVSWSIHEFIEVRLKNRSMKIFTACLGRPIDFITTRRGLLAPNPKF